MKKRMMIAVSTPVHERFVTWVLNKRIRSGKKHGELNVGTEADAALIAYMAKDALLKKGVGK